MLAFAIIIKTLKDKHGDIKLALTFVEKGLTLGNQIYNFYIKIFQIYWTNVWITNTHTTSWDK